MARLIHFSQVNAKCITLRSTFGAPIAFALCLWLLVLPTSELNAQSACGQTVTEDSAINGGWASGCDSQERDGRHARFYTFTLDQQSAVTITLESSVADTYLYLRVGDARSGPHLHLNDDHGGSDSRSQIAKTLAAGTYTIEASTWGAGEIGSFTLTIGGLETETSQPPGTTPPPADNCWQAVTADAAAKGEWISSCYSDERVGRYARFYTFTLGQRSEVTITLVSSDADPYLYLRAGDARSGAHIHENEDYRLSNSISQIHETLISGTYTIEATTHHTGATGSFGLSISQTDTSAEQPATIVRSSTTTLLAGEELELVHESGAKIRIPKGATIETTVVSIDEVGPPEGGDIGVGRVFKFSVGNALLVRPVTIYIPYELRAGQAVKDIDILHWDEELQAWENIYRGPLESTYRWAEQTVEELGLFTSDPRSSVARDDPTAIPEMVEVRVGAKGLPFVADNTLALGQTMRIEYKVRNAGQSYLSAYGPKAAGQVFLTSPGPVQELPKLQSHVPFDYAHPGLSVDHWEPGVIYNTEKFNLGLAAITGFEVRVERPGLHTVRLELVFWDHSGREIARDVVEKEAYVTENPLIDPSEVEVDGRVYSVEGKENAQGKVEYNVTGPRGITADPPTRDKAVYTAALQQAFRAPSHWAIRLLELLGGAVEESLPFLKGVSLVLENASSILTVLFHPSPAAKANATAAIAGSVLKELILVVAQHPEKITYTTALEIAEQAKEKRARWTAIREETRNGVTLSFDRAIEAEDIVRYHNAYWQPAGRTVGIIAAPDYIVEGDVAEAVARGSIGPIEYFAETDFLEGTLSLIEAVAVLGDLGTALEEYALWSEMKRDIKANLSAERTRHTEVLNRLLITDHTPFELPALGEIVIPRYTELDVPTSTHRCEETVTADVAIAGEWAGGCASEERDGSHARFYTFTLSQQSEVTITLESSDADTYLYLREGHARSGSHLYENNDHDGSTSRSQIVEELAATTYTVEATTWGGRETGNFTLTVAGLGTASDPSPGPKIDPVVESPSVSKSSLRSGESFTLSVSVRNQGDDAMASTSLIYYRSTNSAISTSDTVVGRDEVGSLSVGQNSPQSITLTAPTLVGTYYYGACVPPVPGESDTQNNCSDGVRVTVEDTYPDLVVQSSAVSKSSLNSGESFTLSFIVRNKGDGTSPSTTLRYYRSTNPTISSSDTEVGSDSVVSLGPNVPSPESIDLTAPSSAGTYYYGACVDSVPAESSTTNNCSSGVSVTVSEATQGAPDLVVYSPSVYDKVFDPGERFSMAFWVRNEGDGASTATATLKYYRSSDSTISSSDTELTIQSGTIGVGPIAASERQTVSVSLNAHSSGTYYYGACVGTVPNESDTSNNCAAVFKVTLTAPDLVIIRDSVSSSYVEAEDDFTFRATVRNDGTGDSPSTLLRYYRSSDATISTADTQVDTDTVSSLEPDETDAESKRITVPSTTGTYYYGVCVDAVTRESDTTNNCSSGIQVTVTEAGVDAPDLTVDTPVISGFNGLPGDSVRFDITVRNQGEERAGATTLRLYRSTDSTFTSSDRQLITWEVAPLNAGSSRTYYIQNQNVHNWVATLYYGACVDSVPAESSTTNNCSSGVSVTVSEATQVAPDLVVESESVSNSSVETGDTFTFSATVRNQGDGTAGSTTLRYHRSTDSAISSSDTEVGSDSVVSLGPNVPSPESIDLTAPSSAGTYYYGACVDSVPAESSTTNNCSSGVSVTVSEATQVAPDLVVESESVSNSSVETGDTFTFSATVRNQGDGTAGSTTLRYHRSTDSAISSSDTEVGSDSVVSLGPNVPSPESIDLTAPSSAGTYYYGACVDSVPAESSTTNNCSSGVSVTVSEATQVAPDLVVESESVSNSSVETGDTFTFSATVRNQGDGTAGSTTLRYHRSTDSAISSSDTEVGSDSVVSLGPNVPSPESIDLTARPVRARTTMGPAWTPCRQSRARPTTARPE